MPVSPVPERIRAGEGRSLATLVVVLVGAVAYGLNAWRWGTIPDTSWLITVIERLDSGQRLFVDVIELNPPFSIWLYMPPVRLAGLIGVAPESAVRLYTILICLAGTSLAGWMLASSEMLERRSAVLVSIALFAVAVLVSGNSFSERDQIGAVLGLPIVILAAWRALPAPRPSPSVLHWLAAAAGGGVLAMVKPYYAVIVIAAAALLAFRRRDIRAFFHPEFVLAGVAAAAYLALSYVLYPAFFETLLPLLRDTYMPFRQPLASLLPKVIFWLALPATYAIWRRRITRPQAADFLMAASGAAWVAYFIQGKGWAYHAYPAILLGSAALIVGLASLAEEHADEWRVGRLVMALGVILVAHMPFASTEKPADALVAAGLRQGGTPTVGMLGGAIETGHPLARMIGGRWIEPYCSDWLATFAVRREWTFAADGDMAAAERFQALATHYFAGKKARLLADLPQIMIVDRGDKLVPYMLEKFGLQSVLDRYERIAADGGVELYRLGQGAVSRTPSPTSSPTSG